MRLSTSPEETRKIARDFIQDITEPLCLCLRGELGSGKTVFVSGIAEGLGINETIRSPSYVLLRSYKGRMNLYHIDLYRIDNPESILPLEEFFLKDNGITAVEWAEKAEGFLPERRVTINIEILSKNERNIEINDTRD